MSTTLKSEERILKIPVKETRLIMVIGYILRIVSITSVVGYLLTSIGWFKIHSRLKDGKYLVGFTATLLITIIAVTQLVYQSTSLAEAFTLQPSIGIGSREDLIEVVIRIKNEMLNPLNYLPSLIIGLLIIVESISIRQLSVDSKGNIPKYLTILFIILGVVYAIVSIAIVQTAYSLDGFIDRVRNAPIDVSLNDLVMDLYMYIMPLSLVSGLLFLIGIITYVITAVKYWNLYNIIVRLSTMTERGEVKEQYSGVELI